VRRTPFTGGVKGSLQQPVKADFPVPVRSWLHQHELPAELIPMPLPPSFPAEMLRLETTQKGEE